MGEHNRWAACQGVRRHKGGGGPSMEGYNQTRRGGGRQDAGTAGR